MSRRPRRRKRAPEVEPQRHDERTVHVADVDRLDPRVFLHDGARQRHEFADGADWREAVLAWALGRARPPTS
jgi:hypothetical protein